MKKIRWIIEYILFKAIIVPFTYTPRIIRVKVGQGLALFFYLLSRRHRLVSLKNLRIAFSDKNDKWRRKTARGCYLFFGRVMAEIIGFKNLKSDNYRKYVTEIIGLSNLQEAHRKGNGVLCMTAHFGNWEFLGHVVAFQGFDVSVLARRIDNPYINNDLERFRKTSGNRVIYKENAVRTMLKEFRRGKLIGFLMDQNQIEREGIFVEFFGLKASTTPSLALLSLKFDVPIIPCFAIPDGKKKYKILFGEQLKVNPGTDLEKDVERLTQKCNCFLEELIKKYPECWLWMHKRWNTRPRGEAPVY